MSEPRWISTTEAANLLGVNARAVQKRAARGSLPARKVGERWEINADALDASNGPRVDASITPKVDASASTDGRIADAPDVQSVPKVDASNGVNGRVQVDAMDANGSQDGRDIIADLRAQLERERGEVAFLRGIVESDRRDMAEVRAALRSALKLAGDAPAPQLTAGDASAIARDGPQRGETGTTGANSPSDTTGAQRPVKRDGGLLTYGDIADELERTLNH